MRIENQRPSDNFQDRGSGRGGGGGGAMALFGLFRLLGFRGMLIAIVVLGAIYLFNPFGLRDAIFGTVAGNMPGQTQSAGPSTCAGSPTNQQACDFSRRILGSTETVWAQQFRDGREVRGRIPVRFTGQQAFDARGRPVLEITLDLAPGFLRHERTVGLPGLKAEAALR